MTTEKKCDVGGEVPAFRVVVGVQIDNVVLPEMPTGHSEEADACEAHQLDAMQVLFDECVAQLTEQIPHQREIMEKAAERDAVQYTYNTEIAPVLRALDGVAEDKWPTDLKTKRDTTLATIARLEGERIVLLTNATVASDKRHASMGKALKAKAKKH